MAQVHLTLEDDIMKDHILRNREDSVSKYMGKVFDAVLKALVSEKLNAEPYEHSNDQIFQQLSAQRESDAPKPYGNGYMRNIIFNSMVPAWYFSTIFNIFRQNKSPRNLTASGGFMVGTTGLGPATPCV